MAARHPLETAALMAPNAQRAVASYNRLFDGFHGTTAEMDALVDGFVTELRRQGTDPWTHESPRLELARRHVPDWHEGRALLVRCWVKLEEDRDGEEELEVVVETKGCHGAQTALYERWRTNIHEPDRHQTFKRALADAAKYLADYRPCKTPCAGYRCGKNCVDGQTTCLSHWVGVPMQAYVDERAAK